MPIDQTIAIAEANTFLKSYDVNQVAGIQPDEIDSSFIHKLFAKSDNVIAEIVKRLSPISREYLSAEIAFLAYKNLGSYPARVIARAKQVINYKFDPNKKGILIIKVIDPKANRVSKYLTEGYSYIPLGSTGGEQSRIYC